MVACPCHSPPMERSLCCRMANGENIPEVELAQKDLIGEYDA